MHERCVVDVNGLKRFGKEPTSVISRERELEGPRVEIRNSLLESRLEVDSCILAKKACSDVTMTPTCIKIMGSPTHTH